jgi:hypothetical protein
MAMSAAGLGQEERSLRLAAAADARLRALGVGHSMKFWEALLERHIGRARAAMWEDAARNANHVARRTRSPP